MLRLPELCLRRDTRWLTAALILVASSFASPAQAGCRPTGEPGTLVLPLSPERISVPKGAPVGALLGSAHAAIVQDIPYTCSSRNEVRELRVLAPVDRTSGLDNVYSTPISGIGMRITTRGGSFAGIDDGPRSGAYTVRLPPNADHLTGFAVDVDFVKTGDVQGGRLEPGKLASVFVGSSDLVDVVVPDGGFAFDEMQCTPIYMGGEITTGVSTMGAFTQEAVVIGTGCSGSGVRLAIGLDQGYVYGSHPSLGANTVTGRHAAAHANDLAPHAIGIPGVTLTSGSNGRSRSLLDESQSGVVGMDPRGSSGGLWSSGDPGGASHTR
ncbi:hypothetical protein [Paraburkholderia nodosa]|uniref:hypothetical protein n=1 Tax=Paraburkholderia nodosa TaxID=392320 RepID=UPI0038994808